MRLVRKLDDSIASDPISVKAAWRDREVAQIKCIRARVGKSGLGVEPPRRHALSIEQREQTLTVGAG